MGLNAIDGMLAREHGQKSRLGAYLNELGDVVSDAGQSVGASRRYDGPLGKSDRALVFGALGLWVGLSGALPAWAAFIMPLLALLLAATIVRRVRAGLAEAETSCCAKLPRSS